MTARLEDWRSRLGGAFPVDLGRELDGRRAAPDDPCIYVYLTSGAVQEVRPATSVALSSDSLGIYYGERLVASFPRATVFLSSKTQPAAGPNF